ncbi:hypothetical protein [Desulfovibrio ferrophilus]|uniref:Putative lipoprotein n=1 Tax=Desulfovibrio ferrophilus TaxID=241368 RepID=A0A2Z6AYV6_9BACT|nr:hypothetical protein [Desulfovibrio ferrophilus]BBD08355.1 putative lipoprotein [Desulfovibrio ferrophilus]
MTYLRRVATAALLAVCAMFVLASCQRPHTVIEGPAGTLAVAGFFQPESNRDLMAGYLPENPIHMDRKVLNELDAGLSAALAKGESKAWIRPAKVDHCRTLVLERSKGKVVAAFAHWLEVAKCVEADWLLVPQVTYLREREGSEVSVQNAASVTLDLFLISVADESIAARYHFEETQLSLTENILDAGKFVRRGGKWITALELAREGMERGVKEFGL